MVSLGMSWAGCGARHTGSAYVVRVCWLVSSAPSLHLSGLIPSLLSPQPPGSAPWLGVVWSSPLPLPEGSPACCLGPPAWLSLHCPPRWMLLRLLRHCLWTCLSPAPNTQASLLSRRLSGHMKGWGRAGESSYFLPFAHSLPSRL